MKSRPNSCPIDLLFLYSTCWSNVFFNLSVSDRFYNKWTWIWNSVSLRSNTWFIQFQMNLFLESILDQIHLPLLLGNCTFKKRIKFKGGQAMQLAWPLTTSLNRKITIWWGFFRQTALAAMLIHIGANSMKKPHHIVILRFSELVKGHANYVQHISFNLYHMILLHTYVPYSSQQKAKN